MDSVMLRLQQDVADLVMRRGLEFAGDYNEALRHYLKDVRARPASVQFDAGPRFEWLQAAKGDRIAAAARLLGAALSGVDPLIQFEKDRTPRGWTARPNWINIRLQPREQDIVVHIYGRPDLHPSGIGLKEALRSYSRFKVTAGTDPAALRRLLESARAAKRHAPRNAA